MISLATLFRCPGTPHTGDERFHVSRVFWVEANAPRPETVSTAEGLVKYEIIDRPPLPLAHDPPPWTRPRGSVVGVFMVEMLAPDRIRVEQVMGRRPSEVTGCGAHARIYIH